MQDAFNLPDARERHPLYDGLRKIHRSHSHNNEVLFRGYSDIRYESIFHETFHTLGDTAFDTVGGNGKVFYNGGLTGTQSLLFAEYPGRSGILRLSIGGATPNNRAQIIVGSKNPVAGSGSLFHPSSGYTRVVCTFRMPSTASTASEWYQTSVGVGDTHTGASTNHCALVYHHATNNGFYYVNVRIGGTTVAHNTDITPTFGGWDEVMFEFRGTQDVAVFVNGRRAAFSPWTAPSIGGDSSQMFHALLIKSSGAGTATRTLDLDDLKVWQQYGALY